MTETSPTPPADDRSRPRRSRRIVAAVIAVAALAAGAAAVVLLNREPPADDEVTGSHTVAAPAGEPLTVAAHGHSAVDVHDSGPALSLAFTIANSSEYVARRTPVAVTPVDDAGQPLLDAPLDMTVNAVLPGGTMGTATVVAESELRSKGLDGAVEDIAGVQVTVGDGTEWWSDAGDLAPLLAITLDGEIDYRDLSTGLTNLDFTVRRDGGKAVWIDFIASAVFYDADGTMLGGCRNDGNIIAETAAPFIDDCPVPAGADRARTEVFADPI